MTITSTLRFLYILGGSGPRCVVATNGFLQVTQFYSAMKSLCYVAIEKFVSGVKKF